MAISRSEAFFKAFAIGCVVVVFFFLGVRAIAELMPEGLGWLTVTLVTLWLFSLCYFGFVVGTRVPNPVWVKYIREGQQNLVDSSEYHPTDWTNLPAGCKVTNLFPSFTVHHSSIS